MNKKTTSNENNDCNEFNKEFNKFLLKKSMELKMVSEIKGLNCGVIPEMEVDKTVHTIEPMWSKTCTKQIISRAIRK